MLDKRIDAGLELLSNLNAIEMKTIEIRDMLYYLITKDFNKIDEILETAQNQGLVTKTEKAYLITPGISNLKFEKPKIIKQQERSNCRYCGKKLTTGYHVVFAAHTYGPFGASCIRKMHLGI